MVDGNEETKKIAQAGDYVVPLGDIGHSMPNVPCEWFSYGFPRPQTMRGRKALSKVNPNWSQGTKHLSRGPFVLDLYGANS